MANYDDRYMTFNPSVQAGGNGALLYPTQVDRMACKITTLLF